MNIGQKIKDLRKSNSKSQEDLAEDLGVSRQTINRWEKDNAQPNIENIKLLCSIFGLSADYFFDSEICQSDKEIAASADMPKKRAGQKVLIVIAVINGLLLLVGLFFSTLFGSVVFSPNVGDRVVGTDGIQMTSFIVTMVITVICFIAEAALIIFIIKKAKSKPKLTQK